MGDQERGKTNLLLNHLLSIFDFHTASNPSVVGWPLMLRRPSFKLKAVLVVVVVLSGDIYFSHISAAE